MFKLKVITLNLRNSGYENRHALASLEIIESSSEIHCNKGYTVIVVAELCHPHYCRVGSYYCVLLSCVFSSLQILEDLKELDKVTAHF